MERTRREVVIEAIENEGGHVIKCSVEKPTEYEVKEWQGFRVLTSFKDAPSIIYIEFPFTTVKVEVNPQDIEERRFF